jgi:hypothetical protein
MELALEVAAKGDCLAFADVLARLERDDAVTLKLWAGAVDHDKINRACRVGVDKRYAKFGIKAGRTKRKR